MNNDSSFDVAIVGGGLAGLSAAIVCAKAGHAVIVYEKESYPFHKVCGEYISLESRPFLISLGLPLDDYDLPVIDQLELSAPNGNIIRQKLPLGGIGISRFKIDHELVIIATSLGVVVSEGNKVTDIIFENEHFIIHSDNRSPVEARVCCGAFGKRSNLDVKWKRRFVQQKANALNNYIGVKYHAQLEHPRNLISLHNFKGGYCGISPIENGKTCVCYLTNAQNLRNSKNAITEMEKSVLSVNPFLKKTFADAVICYEKPLTISQISFEKKEQVIDHILMLGDAAGLITPLCGNGMSMALHSAKLASELIIQYLPGNIDRVKLEQLYVGNWKKHFSGRLFSGRIIQTLFGKEWLTNSVIDLLKPFPAIFRKIIRLTHGSDFL